MGFIKDFMDNIIKRVSLDAKFNDAGLCINVGLKDAPKVSSTKYYSISIFGLDHPIGGVSLVMLSCPTNNLSAPILDKESDRRMFVTGLFGEEENSPQIAPLRDSMSMDEGTMVFDNGENFKYELAYKYFTAKDLDNFKDESAVKDVILDYICNKLIPDCENITFVYDENAYNKCDDNSLYSDIISLAVKKSSASTTISNIDCVLLSEYIAEYVYSTVVDTRLRMEMYIAGVEVSDVPISVSEQKRWIDSIPKKNEKAMECLNKICKLGNGVK